MDSQRNNGYLEGVGYFIRSRDNPSIFYYVSQYLFLASAEPCQANQNMKYEYSHFSFLMFHIFADSVYGFFWQFVTFNN